MIAENPKILIGCPTCNKYRYCLKEYLNSINEFHYKNHTLLLIDNSEDDSYFNELKSLGINVERIDRTDEVKENIIISRNLLLKRAIEGGYDYLFSLEQDIIAPPTILDQLLASKKDIISAFYATDTPVLLEEKETGKRIRKILAMPIVWLNAEQETIKRANPSQVLGKGVLNVGATGLGCVLISKEVFGKIQFRYEIGKEAFDDMFFCSDAKKLGFKIFLDGNIIVKHLHNDNNWSS